MPEPRTDADPWTDTETGLDAVDQLIDQHREALLEPGLAFGIVHDGRLVYAGGRGERRLGGGIPDADTVFRIASMTKSFTAATVLMLRDEGRLRLDDEVADHVPEVARLRPPTDDAPPLTVRALLTMTAGFPTDDPWGDRQQDLPDEDFARLLHGGLSFAWTPGTTFEYSNLSYALLGRVVSAAAGEPYLEVVTRRLLGPLGLSSTGFTDAVAGPDRLAQGYRRATEREGREGWDAVPVAGYGSFAPMGGLFSTVRDLARWVGGLTAAFGPRGRDDRGRDDGQHADGRHPLSPASRRELQLPHLGQAPVVVWRSVAQPPVVRGIAYGFGLVVERDARFGTLVSHSGGYPGYGSHMRWHPSSGLGVIVLGNATYTPVPRLGSQIMDALLARRPSHAPACATTSMASATAKARRDVTRLISAWDDDLASRVLSMNVDLDEPIAARRRAFDEIVAAIGPLRADDDAPVTSTSPAHCSWWLRGPRGRVRVEIRLTPELPPRVQTLAVTAVPDPAGPLMLIARRVAATLGDADPRWPDDLQLAPGVSPEALRHQLRVAAAWAGPSEVVGVLAGDGQEWATFRLDGAHARLVLAVTVDPRHGAVTDLTLTPDQG